jgi:signal peptidase I
MSMVATIVVVVVVWMAVAPSGLGGSWTYSVTSGISMEPMLHKNDLALVRAQAQYHVGDVVLYDNQLLREPVLHRIVLIQNGDYYFRGDNNDFVDRATRRDPKSSASSGYTSPASVQWWNGWAHLCTQRSWPARPRPSSSWPEGNGRAAGVVAGYTRG